MFCFLNVANKFLLFFQKVLTCFYKVFDNGDFANAINFSFPSLMAAMLVSAMLSKLLLGWIVLIELYNIYILSYACIVGVIIGDGAVVICPDLIIKIVVYRIFTKINIFHKTFIFKLFYTLSIKYSTLLCNISLKFVSVI